MNSALDYFCRLYPALRPGYAPMAWMKRMFMRLTEGKPPSLVDLITGAGKTDLIPIWLIALAWYAKDRSRSPIPRRLVWVVNRRVLVQQVHELASQLERMFSISHPDEPSELMALPAELKSDLALLCREGSQQVFNVVQLRGQRLDDREWSLDPTMPQLIIGTVDQIGSRLCFAGYGLSKYTRPMDAGLLAVDAWLCVDEAHLVPAFVVTLRQLRRLAAKATDSALPSSITKVFDTLPLWMTELSATPGLPKPLHGEPFGLESEDSANPNDPIADRVLAKRTRRVVLKPIGKKLAQDLAHAALEFAAASPNKAVAVFCSKVRDAEDVEKLIAKDFPGRSLLITGRVRGFERDDIAREDGLFAAFRRSASTERRDKPTFLIGTSAAEVGLDADADAIFCDFACLPTLVQRLGRLDRRGVLSKLAKDGESQPPTMTIFGATKGKTTSAQLSNLAALIGEGSSQTDTDYSARVFTGSAWATVVGKEKTGDDSIATDKESKPGVDDAVLSATWSVITEGADPQAPQATQPALWLDHPLASITPGPVVVPAFTAPVLQRWSATTVRTSKFLPVHPWLYGLMPDDEGTPLVGIAFRLELDVLKFSPSPNEDDADFDPTEDRVLKCLERFPPLSSELHFVSLSDARKWLESVVSANLSAEERERQRLAHYNGDEWTADIDPDALSAGSVLVLPTSSPVPSVDGEEMITRTGDVSEHQRCWDVFNAMSENGARYRRSVDDKSAKLRPIGAHTEKVYHVHRVPELAQLEASEASIQSPSESDAPTSSAGRIKWKTSRLSLECKHPDFPFKLIYQVPDREVGIEIDYLDSHLTAASEHGERLAQAIAPANAVLSSLLEYCGVKHDIGKDHLKWQTAMGNTPQWREDKGEEEDVLVAKPVTDTPGSADGYRHEWGSVLKLRDDQIAIVPHQERAANVFLRDLALHLIAAHHGYFRPSMPDRGFDLKPAPKQQNQLRLAAIERASRLQQQLGCWRLAYLETLLKSADIGASRDAQNTNED